MEESCSTFMVVQVKCRTDALQECAAAFKGDKVQQLQIYGLPSSTHADVKQEFKATINYYWYGHSICQLVDKSLLHIAQHVCGGTPV